ncbi:hypothetical protein KPNIH23_28364, partial [Klebsiella pneumoniae subsp. pneumoniae KPNIH23]
RDVLPYRGREAIDGQLVQVIKISRNLWPERDTGVG